ncbi:MAG: type II secretion system minor pseudopilin GspK [Pseudomonadota bacterium]
MAIAVPSKSRGAALLLAMLTVALVATVSAAALWQQWRAIEVEEAERSRVQANWLLTGALDWARLVLREDARSGGVDHLGEPWAVPLQEASLSGFLATGSPQALDTASVTDRAFLLGQITDLQSRLNVHNLIDNGTVSAGDLRSFERLFERLGLEQSQLQAIVLKMQLASRPDVTADDRVAPLMPQRLDQLTWVGASAHTVLTIEPYVTLLPSRTSVNLNTASVEVLHAVLDGLDMADAQRLVTAREQAPFRTAGDAARIVSALQLDSPEAHARVGVASRFFEIQARVRLDRLVVRQRAIVYREGLGVRIIGQNQY